MNIWVCALLYKMNKKKITINQAVAVASCNNNSDIYTKRREPKLTSHCWFVTFHEAKIMWNNAALFSCLLYVSHTSSFHRFISGGRAGYNFRSLILQTSQIGYTQSASFCLRFALFFFPECCVIPFPIKTMRC